MNQKAELKDRVLAKRAELESKLYKARADTRAEGRAQAEKLERKIADLESTLKEGWEGVTESAVKRLNQWLSD